MYVIGVVLLSLGITLLILGGRRSCRLGTVPLGISLPRLRPGPDDYRRNRFDPPRRRADQGRKRLIPRELSCACWNPRAHPGFRSEPAELDRLVAIFWDVGIFWSRDSGFGLADRTRRVGPPAGYKDSGSFDGILGDRILREYRMAAGAVGCIDLSAAEESRPTSSSDFQSR